MYVVEPPAASIKSPYTCGLQSVHSPTRQAIYTHKAIKQTKKTRTRIFVRRFFFFLLTGVTGKDRTTIVSSTSAPPVRSPAFTMTSSTGAR